MTLLMIVTGTLKLYVGSVLCALLCGTWLLFLRTLNNHDILNSSQNMLLKHWSTIKYYLTRAPDNFLKQGVAAASLEAKGFFLQNPEVFSLPIFYTRVFLEDANLV